MTAKTGLPLLAILVVVLFGTPLLFGASWFSLPFMPYGVSPPIQPAYLTGYDNFSFPHVDWPWRVLESRLIRDGSLPLWNPFSSLGLPFPAQYQNQLLFPLEWIELWLSPLGWNIFFVLKVIAATCGAFLLLRSFLRDGQACFIGAAFYGLSPYFLWFSSVTAFVNGAAIVPWVFLATATLLRGEAPAGRCVGALSLVVGLMLLSGQPQISALTLLSISILAACILLSQVHREFRKTLRLAAHFTLALFMGFCVAGLQIYFFLTMMKHGYSLHSPGAYAQGHIPTLDFLLVVSPFSLGQMMWPWDGSLFPGRVNAEAFPFLLGVSGLLLLLLGIAGLPAFRRLAPGTDRRPLVAMIILFFIILIILLSPIFWRPFWSLPSLSRINFPRYIGPVLTLSASAIVAWGVVFLKAGIFSRRTQGVLWITGGCIGLAVVVVAAVAIDASDALNLRYLGFSLVIGISTMLIVAATFVLGRRFAHGRTETQVRIGGFAALALVAEYAQFVRYGLMLEWELLRIGILLALATAALLYLRGSRALSLGIFAFGLLLPATVLSVAERRLPSQADVFQSPPASFDFLASVAAPPTSYDRMLSTQNTLIPNISNVWQISQLNSLNPQQVDVTARYIFTLLSDIEINYTTPNAWPGMQLTGSGFYPNWDAYRSRREYYNLLAVRWLVMAKDPCCLDDHDLPGLALAYEDESVRIFEDHQALPRAFAATAARTVDSEDAVFAAMLEDFSLSGPHILEMPAADLPAELAAAEPEIRPLEIVRIDGDSVEIAVNAEDTELIVLSDAHFPGWQAYADDERTTLYRVNGALRGVVVSPGTETVTMRFRPRWLWEAFALSGVAGGIALVLMAFPAVWPKQWDRTRPKEATA